MLALIYVLVCYPFAGVFGSLKIVVQIGLFLLLNNLCYISLGAVLGVYSKRVPQGMIASTIFSQTSLVAAGFYTKLPPALDWIRYIEHKSILLDIPGDFEELLQLE